MLNYSNCLFVFEKSHWQSIFSGCKRLVTSDFLSSLKDEPKPYSVVIVPCRHRPATWLMARRKCPLLVYQILKYLHWPSQTLLNVFISSYGIAEAVLPCSPASNACRKPQALPKAVSRAHPCSPLPVQAGQLRFPGTTKQRLFGHCQAA